MPKSHFTTTIICVITLIVLLSSQVAWGGYKDNAFCMRGQEAEQVKPEIVSGIAKAMGGQSIITPDINEIPSVDLLGEKPYKLLRMAQAGAAPPRRC